MNISNFGFNSSYLVHTTAPSYDPPQDINDQLENKNTPLDNPLPNLEETSAPTIPVPALSPSSEEIQLSFQEGTSLTISHSQLALLREKSHYFNNLWSGQFQETLQHPLDLTQKDFTLLLNCLENPKFKIPLEKISSSIQLADYYGLTEVVKHLEEQLIDGYKSQSIGPFNSTEESLVRLKELLNSAQHYQLNTLKNYLELNVVSGLLNQTWQLAKLERIINHLSDEIEALNFSNNTYLTDAHFSALKNCKNLKILHFKKCWGVTDARLAHLTPLTNLQHLDLSDCEKLTDDGLAHLTPLTNLQHLNLRDCRKLTDTGLVHLTPLTGLQHLDLSQCGKLTDAGLVHLTPLTGLQHLNLSNCRKLTDAGLAHLKSLVALTHLDLSDCEKLTDEGLIHLTPLTGLQYLDLSSCHDLTDAGLVHLKPLTALQHLNLSNCRKLTDAGLAHLKSLVALTHLDLSWCNNLTDEGLIHLTPLTGLQYLVLSLCYHLTDDGLARFKTLAASLNLEIVKEKNF
ncbi:leucine-rich repeat domain-containing protein [Candidatus Protochlamydia amoebophila]|uniref:leucine-rich repeat domain-containing protein n=1 Tax=Candidatus Protochlamydia amoebophila TaxID=362787 RepID=UPI001BCA511A|nr:BTB/POZ domain-containing protein [Candidatus Protochlamydia amoebophila]